MSGCDPSNNVNRVFLLLGYSKILQTSVFCISRAFEWALSCDGKVSLDEGLEYPDLPGRCF